MKLINSFKEYPLFFFLFLFAARLSAIPMKSSLAKDQPRSEQVPRQQQSQKRGMTLISSDAQDAVSEQKIIVTNNETQNNEKDAPVTPTRREPLVLASLGHRNFGKKNPFGMMPENGIPSFCQYKSSEEAYKKSNNAMAVADQIDSTLSPEVLTTRKGEFDALSRLWADAAWEASWLLKEQNQLQQLLRRNSPLEEIEKSKKALANREKVVKYLFQGALTMDKLLHLSWHDHISFIVASFDGTKNKPLDNETAFYFKEESYRNNVVELQFLAASSLDDPEEKFNSFFQRIADSEYEKMELGGSQTDDKTVTKNYQLHLLCLELSNLRKKTAEKKGLASKCAEETLPFYSEVIECYDSHSNLLMALGEQLMSDNEISVDLLLEYSEKLKALSSNYELKQEELETKGKDALIAKPSGIDEKIEQNKKELQDINTIFEGPGLLSRDL